MPTYPGFCGPSFTAQSLIISPERCVNWEPTRTESPSALTQVALYPTEGVTAYAHSRQVGWRGMLSRAARAFGVVGMKFGEISAAGAFTEKGAVADDGSPAYLTDNGDATNQILIGAGGEGYLYDKATDAFTNPVHDVTFVGMVDEFFVALDPVTSTFKISASLDGSTWDPTQSLQRSDAADGWISMLLVEPEIWLWGENTGSVLFNNGASPFPFAPRGGLIIPYGTAAKHSPALLDGNPVWLASTKGGGRFVVLAQGYSGTRISTDAMEWQIGQYARVDDAEGYSYTRGGESRYVLRFPSARATWVYSALSRQWHERSTWDANNNRELAWRGRCHVEAFGAHLFGDASTGVLYRGDPSLGVDFGGGVMRRVRRGPGLRREGRRIFLRNWQLVLEPGLGAAAGDPGEDPQVSLRYSWNGGKTWGYERWRSAGRRGEYGKQVLWQQIGSGRHFVPEVTVTDPIPWRIAGAEYNVPTEQAA